MNKINDNEIDALFSSAESSSRKRAHLLLHKSHEDKVQRLLIAMVKGSFVEPHYHELSHQWELFTVIKGKVVLVFYNSSGIVVDRIFISSDDVIPMIELKPGLIHSVECLSERALMLEVKEGPFDEVHAKVFPSFDNN
ncbi:WbuC family cupin fold metalloprotein [Photobacterium sp. 53610]|uniref:WbuC family cupin fold metalloprotein n=1 Tax=Photobacterium sp. 53610 TaxID=3102789 RepID=UPI002EDAF81E